MDAATAAIIGAAVGFTGAIGAAWINPFTTAKHAREARYLELRREVYARAIRTTNELAKIDELARRTLAMDMFDCLAQMQLVGSPDVAALYGRLVLHMTEMHALAARDSTEADRQAAGRKAFDLRDEFIAAARADIGVHDRYAE